MGVEHTIQDKIAAAQNLLADLPHGQPFQESLVLAKERFQNRQVMVAVFGAFSAGKSSLLNALLEQPVLTVSPNPTTATVTKILAGRQGELWIEAKSKDEVWQDVSDACRRIQLEADSLETALAKAESLQPAQYGKTARTSLSYLKAVSKGYPVMRHRLGQSWNATLDELRSFTADESLACYVREVQVPLANAPFAEGFVLVDTPGVDSIHRRHTNVAFNYMRQADAIVFVLYYTHAFSRADKNFLQQLADVQNVMGQNKLYVVVNAVDLAVNEEERHAVEQRVRDELRSLGIVEPRIYGVSSQLALAAKQLKIKTDPKFEQMARVRLQLGPEEPLPVPDEIWNISGLEALQKDLMTANDDVRERLRVETLQREMTHLMNQIEAEVTRLGLLQRARAEERERFVADVETAHRLLQEEKENGAVLRNVQVQLQSDCQELIFHIGERIRLRFSNLFREAFYPGRFVQSKETKMALQEAAVELAGQLETQILVETRTFSLRLQKIGQELLEQAADALCARLPQMLRAAINIPDIQIQLPEVQAEDVHMNHQPLLQSLHYFRSARQFFEEGGQRDMLEAVEPLQMGEVKSEISRLTTQLLEHLQQQWAEMEQEWIEAWMLQLRQFTEQGRAEEIAENQSRWQFVAEEWAKLWGLSRAQ
ncbi:dynamin family protein [Alicyclobacillus tolerans]|uniref:dynamin family protein n=1 Tax=Alicyclobacillus tolerans TaxID=90970 RepID=UPI003B808FD2